MRKKGGGRRWKLVDVEEGVEVGSPPPSSFLLPPFPPSSFHLFIGNSIVTFLSSEGGGRREMERTLFRGVFSNSGPTSIFPFSSYINIYIIIKGSGFKLMRRRCKVKDRGGGGGGGAGREVVEREEAGGRIKGGEARGPPGDSHAHIHPITVLVLL